MKLKFLLCLFMSLCVIAASAQQPKIYVGTMGRIFDRKQPNNYWNHYGAYYPMFILPPGSAITPERQQVQEWLDMGADGMVVDTLSGTTGYLQAASGTTLKVAPMIDFGRSATSLELLNKVNSYCATASQYTSASKINNAYLIFCYTGSKIDWEYVKANSTYPLYLVGKVGGYVNHSASYAASCVTATLDNCYDAYYGFENTFDVFDAMAAATGGKPFLGDIAFQEQRCYLSGSYPYTGVAGQGTYTIEQFAAKLPKINQPIVCLNWEDFVEDDVINPNTDTGFLYSDYLAFMLHRSTFATAKLYITTSQSIWQNQQGWVDATLLNPTAQSIQVKLKFRDSAGNLLQASSVIVAPHDKGSTRFPIVVSIAPSSRFVYAEASSSDGQYVKSAPIIVYPALQPDSHDKGSYYSLRADKVLSSPILSLSSGTLTVQNTSNSVWINIMEDQNLLGIISNTGIATLDGFNASAQTNRNNFYAGQFGICLARVIGSDGSVGYSNIVLGK